MPDGIGLDRFLTAQARSFDTALAELRAGCKRTHWMWWIFPQLRGLGRSDVAQFYAIEDLAEAKAYLAEPVLRDRLEAAANALLCNTDLSADTILGSTDALKLRSSATLFTIASNGKMPSQPLILQKFFLGQDCAYTRNIIKNQ
ncbi:DUF1810 domain-containing protein [Rhodobacteraceae bacterium]|nr:DUF1810 domain-containing protein [Paracoccaceae bacterium]